ncbi:predicted protein [Sclerotinia sclerotiorum 1980 UF-70]|uniref:Uncharacterized protein n=1 Tax=Sclerotinia sclerotiorum (strain ATCC 18683 / 1980 / Ss-1) TaxID=665079 RepID=A7E8T5_SCLS1|nr:predicted protein [Sclerotinia sclerotiorum 1980 UF-70]EDN96787.1 predicted protein [Sclerotinia sclerotiorum 1980 UF-70]
MAQQKSVNYCDGVQWLSRRTLPLMTGFASKTSTNRHSLLILTDAASIGHPRILKTRYGMNRHRPHVTCKFILNSPSKSSNTCVFLSR